MNEGNQMGSKFRLDNGKTTVPFPGIIGGRSQLLTLTHLSLASITLFSIAADTE